MQVGSLLHPWNEGRAGQWCRGGDLVVEGRRQGPQSGSEDPEVDGAYGHQGAAPADALGEADAALVFADDAASLRAILGANVAELAEPRAFWVAYPKGNRSDVNRDSLWPILAEHEAAAGGEGEA